MENFHLFSTKFPSDVPTQSYRILIVIILSPKVSNVMEIISLGKNLADFNF